MNSNHKIPPQDTYTYDFLEIPNNMIGDTEQFFNRKSRVIVVSGPRGNMLAHYPSRIIPDPNRHQFYVCFHKNYKPFDGAVVPPTIKADITALAQPIEKVADNRLSVVSNTPPDIEADIAPSPTDLLIMVPQGIDQGSTIPHTTGIKVGAKSMEAHFGGGGLGIDETGVRISGQAQIQQPVSKGVTQESPLFGILPKTAVTFWAADYLPDLKKLRSIAEYILLMTHIIETIRDLADLVATFTTRNNN